MPNPIADLNTYKTGVDTDVTTKVAINSISPVEVGAIGTDLADLLLPYLQSINNQDYFQGTGTPNVLVGADLDLYYQQLISGFSLWRKQSGVWVLKVTMVYSAVEDGIITGLRTFIDGMTVTVSSGTWSIDNVRYSKATQTQFTVPAADANFMRYDLIYADNVGAILYLAGTASSTPAFPTPPADTVVIDYVIVPSVASTADPYLFSGGDGSSIGIATESEPGIIELATEAEALAGTDAVRAITPATLAAVLEEYAPSSEGIVITESSPYFNSSGGGVIIIDDFLTAYPEIAASGIVRLHIEVGHEVIEDDEVKTKWIPSDVLPDTESLEKNEDGHITYAKFFIGQHGIVITNLIARSTGGGTDSSGGGGGGGEATNLSIGTRTSTEVPILSSTGTDATLPVATTSLAGLQSAADKTKLDGIATGATANQTDAYLLSLGNATGSLPATSVTEDSTHRFVTDAEIAAWDAAAGGGVALGETNTTAYRGDRGKTAYDHSQLTSGNPHSVTKSEVGLGSVDNTSDSAKPVSTAQQTAIDAKVADNLTASTTVAPSKTAVNTAIASTLAEAKKETICVAISDETTAITTGTAKVTFRMPFAMTLTGVRANLNTASSSGIPTFDINENGTTILSTKLTIDASEKTSVTAATAAVISDANLADDAEITIDIDVAGTGAKGAKIYLIGSRT